MTGTPSDSVLTEVLSNTDLAVLVWQLHDPDDPGGMQLVYATPGSQKLTLRSPDQAVGLTLREVWPPFEQYPQLTQYAEVALGAAARDMGDVEIAQEPFGPATYAVKIYPLSGRRVAVIARDVTGQRQATTDVVKVLNSITDAFFVYDDQWRYTFVNSAGERFAQTPKEEMLGKCVWDVFPEVVGTPVEETMMRAAQDKVTSYTEVQPAYADLWFSVWAYPTANGVAVYMQDITELKRLEEHLQQAQKMDAVARLAGTIAHDFNNAITAIRAAATLAMEVMDDGEARADVSRVDDIAAHAAALTEQLLTIARSQPLPASPTSVHEALSSLHPLISSLVTETISLEIDLAAPDDVVLIDPSQLRQIVLNLVLNARDAMTAGGAMRVSTRNLTIRQSDTPAQGLDSGTYLALTVSDTGCGMSEEVMTRAMEPFFTTSPEGTGLGLTSVYNIAQQAGGYVEMTSAVGEGTEVSVVLPTTSASPSDSTREATPLQKGNATILLVEDDEDVRPLLARALIRLGYRVIVTAGGQEALAAANADGGHIDLVLTDVLMPGMTGGEMVDQLRQTRGELKALFMSGYAADELARRGIDDPSLYLQKPFQVSVLAERVAAALNA